MLIGKNHNHLSFLNIFSSFKEVLDRPIYPPLGGNADAGIVLINHQENCPLELGIYYCTASGREVLTTYDMVYCIGMDESSNFRSDVEASLETELKLDTETDFLYCPITLDRFIDDEDYDSSMLPLGVAYFMNNYKADSEKNQYLLKIENKLVKDGMLVGSIKLPLEILEMEQEEEQHLYDFYAYLYRERKKEKQTKKDVLKRIVKFLEG